jgi:hypothetical protein
VRALRHLLGRARALLARLTRAVLQHARSVGSRVTAAARATAGTARAAAAEARSRHTQRWSRDDQYRGVLLAALGALLSTLVPPAVAAAVTAGIGFSGLLDAPRKAAADDYRPGYRSQRSGYDSDQPDRGYGARLWDRFSDEE